MKMVLSGVARGLRNVVEGQFHATLHRPFDYGAANAPPLRDYIILIQEVYYASLPALLGLPGTARQPVLDDGQSRGQV